MPKRRLHRLPLPRITNKRPVLGPQGDVPGALLVVPGASAPSIRAIGYGPDELCEESLSVDEVREFVDRYPVAWIDVEGLGDTAMLQRIGKEFNLHPLVLEDVTTPQQRAKIEAYADYLFVVGRMAHRGDDDRDHVIIEQFSMFLGDGFVLSFQEHHGDCLDPVRERIRNRRGRIRKAPADYLAYALLDALTDAYFPILEDFGKHLDQLEQAIIDGDGHDVVHVLHNTKRALMPLQRAALPLRDAVNFLMREPDPRLSEETRVFMRDVADHISEIVDVLHAYRDLSSSLMDLHFSMMSHRMNEVMQVLTIIATIFIPLSFVVGLYGMNFDTGSPYNMPELKWQYGYLFSLGVMFAMVAGMLAYFRQKRWF